MNIHVIIGSTRPQRFSEKPANWIFEELKKRPGVTAELIDLRDYPMPFYNEPSSPKMMGGKYPNPDVTKWAEKVKQADGYIMVTPEYNHGYSAVLKNALDQIYPEWNNKPVGFISYGSAGGARAIEQLRLVAIELMMVPIKTSIHIPGNVYMAALKHTPEDKTSPFEPLAEHATAFLDQLIWWTSVLENARKK